MSRRFIPLEPLLAQLQNILPLLWLFVDIFHQDRIVLLVDSRQQRRSDICCIEVIRYQSSAPGFY